MIKVNIASNAIYWQHVLLIWCIENLASLLWYACQKECESNHKGTSDKSKLRDVLQTNWPELFKMLMPWNTQKNPGVVQIKYKEKILKAARGKQQITYKKIPISLTADLSAETMQARKEWQDIFKVMKGKYLQPRLLYRQGSHSDSMEKLKALQTSKS